MSHPLTNPSEDLAKLRDEGFALEWRSGHLLIHDIPYVTGSRTVEMGTLVTTVDVRPPSDHKMHFIGSMPHLKAGGEITGIKHSSEDKLLGKNLLVNHLFSNKPPTGYRDYYHKVTRYADIISAEAAAIDPKYTARTHRLIPSEDNTSPFLYLDTASSRAGIMASAQVFSAQRVAIVGLGGTGSHVLDLVAKTAVAEIHVYDGDRFHQHNAFRAPGAAPVGTWEDGQLSPYKVQYFAEVYARMRRGVVPHTEPIDETNIGDITDLDFVFICVDKGPVRKLIVERLRDEGRSFIDTGLGVQRAADPQQLLGMCRVTTGTPGHYDHLARNVPMADVDANNEYTDNIQTVEMNALNALMAVLKWKRLSGFYADERQEFHSTYSTSFNQMNSAERMA